MAYRSSARSRNLSGAPGAAALGAGATSQRVAGAVESSGVRRAAWRSKKPMPPPCLAASASRRAASRGRFSASATPAMPPRNATSSAPKHSASLRAWANSSRAGSSPSQARPGGYRQGAGPVHSTGRRAARPASNRTAKAAWPAVAGGARTSCTSCSAGKPASTAAGAPSQSKARKLFMICSKTLAAGVKPVRLLSAAVPPLAVQPRPDCQNPALLHWFYGYP